MGEPTRAEETQEENGNQELRANVESGRRLVSRLSIPSRLACSDVSTYPSWTLIDVPTSGSILIYSQFV
jgi:hypothetical protein